MGLFGKKKESILELDLEQANSVIQSIVKKAGYPYRIFSSQISPQKLMEQYEQELAEGKEKGYVPILVPEDEVLEEYFEILYDEDGYTVEEALSLVQDNGGEILAERWKEYLEDMKDMGGEDAGAFQMEEWIGGIEGGEEIDLLTGVLDFGSGNVKETILFRIPTKNPWEAVVYLPFGGWNDCPAPEEMASMCKYWYEKYGAVPAVITHDTLEMILPKPVPEEEALETAKEHYAFCNDRVDQCTRTGTAGEVADCIRRSKIWFFWWD